PDGSLAATTGGNDNETFLWKTADAALVHRLAGKGRTVWSVGWGPDGKSIALGNTSRYQSDNDQGPIERAFHLADLELTPASDAPFPRAGPARGAPSLKKVDATPLAVERNGATTATIKLKKAYDEVRCYTLLPDDRVAVGAEFGLYLCDARTGQ